MTRLEKIRSMTAEELAGQLVKSEDEPLYCMPEYCPYWRDDGTCASWSERGDAGCVKACVAWLNREIEDK